MKKLGLILGLSVSVAVLTTACTSNQSTQSPETAQQTATMSDQQSAQSATVDAVEQGAAAESDANAQSGQPVQATNDPNSVQQPSAQ